jgi:hypothetical protein
MLKVVAGMQGRCLVGTVWMIIAWTGKDPMGKLGGGLMGCELGEWVEKLLALMGLWSAVKG